MVVIAMGQMLLSFNVAALPVSMGGMVDSFHVPPTTIATAIVLYSLCVSAFILPGAKLGQRFGSRRLFQLNVMIFAAAMATMAFSPNAETMFAAKAIAGFACVHSCRRWLSSSPRTITAASKPRRSDGWGRREPGERVGLLGWSAIATFLTWRVTFGLFVVHAAAVLLLSVRLMRTEPKPDVKIDAIGTAL